MYTTHREHVYIYRRKINIYRKTAISLIGEVFPQKKLLRPLTDGAINLLVEHDRFAHLSGRLDAFDLTGLGIIMHPIRPKSGNSH